MLSDSETIFNLYLNSTHFLHLNWCDSSFNSADSSIDSSQKNLTLLIEVW